MRRRAMALVIVGLVFAQPVSVAASAYSSVTNVFDLTPPGYGMTSLCGQAGIVDVASNYGQSISKNYVAGACSGASKTLPSGWLAVENWGYKDGAYCGTSGRSYSSVATAAWQLWISLCSNPAGTQSFNTRVWATAWVGNGYLGGPVLSPSQNY